MFSDVIPPGLGLALCALGPFAAALLALPLHKALGRWAGLVLASVPAVIGWYLAGFVGPIADGQTITGALEWIPAYGIELSFVLDGLSLTFALLISGIGALILIYSGSYLRGHEHLGRFLSFLMLFTGAMLGLVLSDNMVALYGFWELTTVASFLLIGFDHMRQAARRAAIQALVVTNAGGLALLVGAIVLQQVFGSWELSGLRGMGDAVRGHAVYGLVLTMVLVAAFTKSAQVPFHFWLPSAMQAPTPVSAFLHSATMVQAGVYLLARMFPLLGGTQTWTWTLALFGGATLLWGAIAALRQTDLKQLLAQTTIASLGLLVLLFGIGTDAAIAAAVVYFVAHALYKAALFLVAGVIENETGARDLTALGGLREKMALTFIAAVLAAVSMVGIPPAIGFIAKEESYLAATLVDWRSVMVLVVLIAGNALLGAAALAVAIKPFMGALQSTPKAPGEGPVGMLAGPLLLATLGIAAGVMVTWFAGAIVAPAVTAISGAPYEAHAGTIDFGGIVFWLTVLTWVAAGLIYWQLDPIRKILRRGADRLGWTFDKGFDAAMFWLIRLSGAVTRFWHHGRLELYLVVIFATLALALTVPFIAVGPLPAIPSMPDMTFYEWGIVALAAIGIVTVFLARTRLFAIIALGIQGLAVAMLYLLFGAPDLSFTQFMVEVLSVVILTLVMTRLKLDSADHREFEDLLRDGIIALACGVGVVLALLTVLGGTFDGRLSEFFAANSVPLAHGHNIVNVILVDFRGLDTLGEIAVVMTAGIAILALIRSQPKRPAASRRRRAPKVEAAP